MPETAKRVTAEVEAQRLADEELIRMQHPDLGGEPAVTTRAALRDLWSAKGFKEVTSPVGDPDVKYATVEAGDKAAVKRAAEALKEDEV